MERYVTKGETDEWFNDCSNYEHFRLCSSLVSHKVGKRYKKAKTPIPQEHIVSIETLVFVGICMVATIFSLKAAIRYLDKKTPKHAHKTH